ncbi:MAG: non-homologous end-joining DNA ligase [Acidimicrobiales bacterium]|nr:non-homologous end-joining DNA ligase [Acidimicrobiales bacterium]
MSLIDDLDDDDRALLRRQEAPDWVEPMLATLTDEPFSDPGWVYERKLDGERAIAYRTADRVRLRTRNGKHLRATYPEVADALAADQPGGTDLVVDGEVVAFDGDVTSFARLQGRMGITDPDRARRSGIAVAYYAFDLVHLDGWDLTRLPLRRRKALLRQALRWEDPLRFTPHRNEDGEAYLAEACRRGWEGLIAKRAEAPYRHRRSRDWLKLKCTRGQELVIGGYTDPEGSRQGFGALLVGYHDGDRLVYAGKVGTGFDQATLRDLGRQLADRSRETSPFDAGSPPRRAHWVRPDLVCEVGFTEWTRDGRLRHPRFQGLRDDKDAADVVREEPGSMAP